MKVVFVDARLRRHSVDVDEGASVAHLKLLLAKVSPVPAGFVSKLVYQRRIFDDGDSLKSIRYSPGTIVSLFCVRAAPTLAACDHKSFTITTPTGSSGDPITPSTVPKSPEQQLHTTLTGAGTPCDADRVLPAEHPDIGERRVWSAAACAFFADCDGMGCRLTRRPGHGQSCCDVL